MINLWHGIRAGCWFPKWTRWKLSDGGYFNTRVCEKCGWTQEKSVTLP